MPTGDFVQSLVDKFPPSLMVCAKQGSLLNPYKVEIRNHERKAMVYRYLVYKGLETAFMGMLTRGQSTGTIDEIPGFPNPLLDKPDLPVELALREGLELAIAGQAEKNSWFYFAGEPKTLFYRDSGGDITHCHNRASGSTTEMRKSSISDFVDQRMKKQDDFERAVRDGRAI
jgi:hypothetical protein